MLLCPGIDAVDGRQGGAPCFVGTRLPVQIVADIARHAGPVDAIRTYPQITLDQVNIALAFMAGARWAGGK